MERDRDHLGKIVREAWIAWAKEQPSAKISWLLPWETLDEFDKEADRRIGEAVLLSVEDTIEDLIFACQMVLEQLDKQYSPETWRILNEAIEKGLPLLLSRRQE